jgi:energy-coupling factor transporter ATP-binding protein EcfA2
MSQDAVTPHPHQAPTRNLLTEFCSAADAELVPVFPPLAAAQECFSAAAEDRPARRLLPAMQDLQHQLRALADRIQQQQAFVLIFGPLKSGKSTFMNAMAGSYVSEVTALPAYPCMVYVSHAEEPEFLLTAYDGSQTSFRDRQEVVDEIEQAHRRLTARLREVEAAGRSFDPGTDMPSALRRVDVRVPAAELETSGAVLVDTPGLYTRMKFGYDRMTRDFRDAAACAVFIVKTENLFLEQVFAEFEDLLDLFSRIFLVVNLDRSKRDLMPDGSLKPSLEHDDPQRILDAFEHLAMSAPLKQAADDGRLRIFPVDLLHAASARLSGESDVAEAHGFDELLADLTDYLDSNEYLHAFMADSLRRGEDLFGELAAFSQRPAARDLLHEEERLAAEEQALLDAFASLEELATVDWDQAFAELATPLSERLALEAESGEAVEVALGQAQDQAIDAWFKLKDSFSQLASEVDGQLDAWRHDWAQVAIEELRKRTTGVTGRLVLGVERRASFDRAGLPYDAFAGEVLDRLSPRAALPGLAPVLDLEEMPVKRGFWDYLLFRSEAKLRRRLLGETRKPDRKLAPELKAKRLGDPARRVLHAQAGQARAECRQQMLQGLGAAVAAAFSRDLAARLAEVTVTRRAELEERQAELADRREACRRECAALAAMTTAASERAAAWQELRQRFPQRATTAAPGREAAAATKECSGAESAATDESPASGVSG